MLFAAGSLAISVIGGLTTVADAIPIQAMRIPGLSWLPLLSAIALGTVLIAARWKLWFVVAGASVATVAFIVAWLWTGTALIPEKPRRGVGLGMTLPIYASGPRATGWWSVVVSMVGLGTAMRP